MNRLGTYEGNPAVNVKVQQRLPDLPGADDAIREAVWDGMCFDFWVCAQSIAHKHDFSGVFSEGRSGGWAVPFYQAHNGKLQKFARWPGQGPEWGYPTYPSIDDDEERRQFERFAQDVVDLVESAAEEFRARLTAEVGVSK